MASSIFIGNRSSSDLEMSLMNGSGDKPTRLQTGKPSSSGGGGRRKTKSKPTQTKDNKKPKRGMGVEKLERLSFQARINKMTEINNLHHPPPFTTLLPTPPAAFFAYSGGGGVGVGQGFFNVHHQSAMLLHSHGAAFLADPFAAAAAGSGFRGTTETSKELSSIPNNLKWNSSEQQCGICYKKFRGNRENLTCIEEMQAGFGSFGNGSKENMFINGGNPYYVSKPTSGQEVEVTAVHRKGMKTGEGGGGSGSALMEYEFFPRKDGEINHCKYKEEIINVDLISSKAVIEASCDHHYHHHQHQDFGYGDEEGGGDTNSIDLSLKLSSY